MARIAIVLRLFVAGCVAATASPRSTHANSDETQTDSTSWQEKTSVDAEPAFENWIGAEGYHRVASLYSGITWAPVTNLRQDGLRLRVIAGISNYRYAGRRFNAALGVNHWQQFSGAARFLDVMAGWQTSFKNTTVKAFVGFEQQGHLIAPFDLETQIQGVVSGAKGTLEIWHNWTPAVWTSLDASAARAHASYDLKLRAGWRAVESWSFGPELSHVGHSESTLQRLGVFGRYEDQQQEFTISAGVSRAIGDIPSGYGAAQYLRRF